MDTGTYDVWLDGELIVEDLAHGITDRGVGNVLFGCGTDSDLDGHFNADAISVTDLFQETPAETQCWGRIETAFRR
jgi:hypothetical protein